MAAHRGAALTQTLFTWLPVGGFQVDVGFLADPLSVTMLLFVTGIAALIHLYAIGYMHGDPRFSKFFVYLNLFVFSMIMLVLGDNLLVTFLGWEGVGACSYFLIAFWHESEANASAGKKAFVTNRIGDFGFMVAIFFTFNARRHGQLRRHRLGVAGHGHHHRHGHRRHVVRRRLRQVGPAAAVRVAARRHGRPDAGVGADPRRHHGHRRRLPPHPHEPGDRAVRQLGPVDHRHRGAGTALFAATIAVAQNDIKKVLAYSTVSQLGYMFLAIGSGAYVAAIFHMVTHAFFKALMFLGSGSVIHGMHDEQDMRRMGALRKVMPITAATFIVGWLAISGFPFFSGFFSKDDILLYAYEKSPLLWAVGLVTALLTAFYMSRQVFMVFYGEPKWDRPLAEAVPELAAEREASGVHEGHGVGPFDEIHPHESGWKMLVPLLVLAPLAFAGGLIETPFSDRGRFLEHWLEPVVHFGEAHVHQSTGVKISLALIAVAAGILGIALAAAVYLRKRTDLAAKIEKPIFAEGWRYDATITAFMGGPGRKAFDAIAWFDKTVVDGAVNGVGTLVREGSGKARLVQTGYVRNYALGIAFGAVVLTVLLLTQAVY